MSRATDKEHRLSTTCIRAHGAVRAVVQFAGQAPWWSALVVSATLCAAPAGAQTRVHNPNAQKPPPAASNPTPPANSAQPANANPSTNSNPPANPKPPANSTPPTNSTAPANPTPPASNPPPSPSGLGPASRPGAPPPATANVTAADALRGLLVGLDLHAGTITLARTGFPPATMHISTGASITRDGVPVHLGDLETGSSTAISDHILVATAGTTAGGPLVTRIKATSRDHFWYGHMTSIDPSSATVVVTRADGQRRAFQLNDRTNVLQFGAGNVAWSALHVGGMVEVDWIPGDSENRAPVLQAHSIVLNKPYEGIQRQPATRH
jgi:hypothetical protein